MSDEAVKFYRSKAEQCRTLAMGILNERDPTKGTLEQLAQELDAKADALEFTATRLDETEKSPGSKSGRP